MLTEQQKEQLQLLKELYDQGILTEEEFESKKKAILYQAFGQESPDAAGAGADVPDGMAQNGKPVSPDDGRPEEAGSPGIGVSEAGGVPEGGQEPAGSANLHEAQPGTVRFEQDPQYSTGVYAQPELPRDDGGKRKKEKKKKPFFKRVWFWVIVVIVIIIIAAAASGGGDSGDSSDAETTQTETVVDETESDADAAEDESDAEETAESDEPVLTKITASYDGDTEAGTVLGENNSGITVTAYYDDGTTKKARNWTVEKAKTLKAGKSSKITIEYEGVTTELKVKCTTLSASQYKEKCKTYDYEDLARTPDDYVGKYMKIYGEVIQVQESDDSVTLRVATLDSGYGYYDDVVMVYYEYSDKDVHILEDDMITMWGIYGGTYTYESVLGSDITVPLLYAEYFALDD